MIWLFCSEIECYGEYFKLGEFVYDCLFLWGFKWIGLDLYWVGGKYLDSWYYNYMLDLESMFLGFIMFLYFWLLCKDFNIEYIVVKIKVL